MPSSFSRRAKRFTAQLMLGLWLLGLGLGIANACLAQEHHARHGHIGLSVAAIGSVLPGAHLPVAITPTSVDASSSALFTAQLACQDFCAGAQFGVFKQPGDAQQPLITWPVPLVSSWPDRPSPYRHVLWSVRGDLAGSHPPAFIGFLRMTI
jgi:hypothetical protein